MKGLDFNRTMEGVLEFLRLRDEIKAPTRIQMSYLELPENKSDTEEFRDFWGPKVDAVEVWKPHNFGDGRDYRERLTSSASDAPFGRCSSLSTAAFDGCASKGGLGFLRLGMGLGPC